MTGGSKIKLAVLLLSLIFQNAFAQNTGIYLPQQMRKLYNGNTRTWEGKPGKDYWVNKTDYKIKIDLDTVTARIKGSETITFYNNSPDDLDKIVVQLFNNIFRKGNQRDFEIAEEDITDGVKINKLIAGGKEMNLEEEIRYTSTNMIISNLPDAVVEHGKSIELYFEWETELPKISQVRMGKYADGVIFAAYFYPKVAVYDDVFGWDELEYSGDQEFYSDFGNYEVEITLPGNYLVWATGELQNPEEQLNENIYKKYKEAIESDTVINIVTKDDLINKTVTNNKETNTWKFVAENVPDFSFSCSDHYLWDGVSTLADESTGRKVFLEAAYGEGAKFYEEAALYGKRTVEYFSTELPGVPFPYPKFTLFNNMFYGGGMETPMMANDGEYSYKSGFVTLIIHEMAHTYFPFLTGVNERRYSWMDEGWASFFPGEMAGKYFEDYNHHKGYLDYYRIYGILGTEDDLPLITPTHTARGNSLIILSYARAFFAEHALQDLLGEDLFKKCLKEYINRWTGKHPLPYDFFFTFNDVAGEDLSWFWKPWYYEFGECDYALEKSQSGEIKLIKKGNLPLTVEVKLKYEDDSEEIVSSNTRIWQNADEVLIKTNSSKKIKSAEILTNKIPDFELSNNFLNF
ncbi:MAG: hypothetical protein A2068_06785 [Ignavibacteria bacterium GWB2_35_6b]|nr:MAG: hypothetical protein A2068_06785 [Ignavibacteria bacterium GWB2_35_6b]